MKRVNHERIIPNSVGPRLSYHGFKYDESESYPAQGQYSFTRTYWCTHQSVSIGLVEYDAEDIEAVISQGNDSPIEVPQALLRIQEPGFRLWLSNKYVLGVLQSEHRSIYLMPNRGIDTEPVDAEEVIKGLKAGPSYQAGQKLPTWWEFHGENDLRRVLDKMVRIIVTDGLDWFEDQVTEVRRHHDKLDRRREDAKKQLGG